MVGSAVAPRTPSQCGRLVALGGAAARTRCRDLRRARKESGALALKSLQWICERARDQGDDLTTGSRLPSSLG